MASYQEVTQHPVADDVNWLVVLSDPLDKMCAINEVSEYTEMGEN